MKMGASERTPAAWAIFSSSLGDRDPSLSFLLSTPELAERSRWAICSLAISRLNMATWNLCPRATLQAMFSIRLLLPMLGLEARITMSERWSPPRVSSRAGNPQSIRPSGEGTISSK